MEEIAAENVPSRALRGVFALVTRTFTIQILNLIGVFILSIFLSPSVFGVFFIVSAAIAFLSYFSDIGLAAALIQKKEQVSEEDLATTFTIQQILVGTLALIALLLSQRIGSFYNLQGDGIFLFQALVISFFLSSLKTIPSIILERQLRFEKLIVPQIVEAIAFNTVAVILALAGFGLLSFAYAVLVRGVLGLLVLYLISPWRIRVGISKNSAKKLLSFGIPFQANSVLALIKDDLLIVYLGKVLSFREVGYLGFAQKWAFIPLRLITDNVIRILFPSFSRIQDQKESLKKGIEKAIFASCLFVLPANIGLVVLAPFIIEIVPRYSKWEPAIVALAFFSINAVFSTVSTTLTNFLNATGKIKTTLNLMIFWTIATWLLTPISIKFFGFNGVAIASAAISTSVILVVLIVKKHLDIHITKAFFYPMISSIVMAAAVFGLSQVLPKNIISLFTIIAVGASVYFSLIYMMAKEETRKDLRLLRDILKNK